MVPIHSRHGPSSVPPLRLSQAHDCWPEAHVGSLSLSLVPQTPSVRLFRIRSTILRAGLLCRASNSPPSSRASTLILWVSPTDGTRLVPESLYSLGPASAWDSDPVPGNDSSPENLLILASARAEIDVIQVDGGEKQAGLPSGDHVDGWDNSPSSLLSRAQEAAVTVQLTLPCSHGLGLAYW